jgi:glycosyltransferase involved in cell wall biosynthesis
MNSLQITASLTAAGGGVSLAVLELSGALMRHGTGVEVAGMADGGTPLAWPVALAGREYPAQSGFPLTKSDALHAAIAASGAGLFHTHGLWTFPSVAVPSVAKCQRTPWVVSPHGMLDAWALHHSRWKKRVASILFERRHLAGSSCLHALCAAEANAISAHGLKNPVAVIPNGVALPGSARPRSSRAGRKVLLFLGRLHPKKGLLGLLEAWAGGPGRGSDWQLVIAGWDQGGHEMELKRCCGDLSIPWTNGVGVDSLLGLEEARSAAASVVFAGPVFGEIKRSVLEHADAFILPSFSEGLPISVLEAWSYGLPVLMTPECNLPEGVPAGAALEIGAGGPSAGTKDRVPAIRQALGQLMEMSPEERHAMGAAGRRLVENRFSWPRVAMQMTEVYQWVAGGGPKPDTVL